MRAVEDASLVEWLRIRARAARRTASVCTGAFLLAAAGLLDHRRAVTHWEYCDELSRRHPAVTVEPDPIFVHDGPMWTSAGVTSGIDLSLALVEGDLERALALSVARQLVVFLKRPGGQAQFSAALSLQSADERFANLHVWLAEHLAEDLSLSRLASQAGMSERTFLRRHREATGVTPARAIERLRVEAARQLLANTRLPAKRIATRCGFRLGRDDAAKFCAPPGRKPAGLSTAFRRRMKVTEPGKETSAAPANAPRPWVILRSFAGWRVSDFGADAVAGLTLAAIAIPSQMATARLAGLPPRIGFFALLAGAIGFALFGDSRRLAVGADLTIAPIFAGSLAVLAAAGTGPLRRSRGGARPHGRAHPCLRRFLRFGFVADLLSIPVTTGFFAGIAGHILVSQAPSVLGIEPGKGPLSEQVLSLVERAQAANPWTVVMGLGVLAIMLAGERMSRRFPAALIGLFLAEVATVTLGFEARGVATLGSLAGAALVCRCRRFPGTSFAWSLQSPCSSRSW